MEQEFSDETLQNDRYRIVKMVNGDTIIGKIINAGPIGILLKNPVLCTHDENEVYFTVLFNGMSKSKNFFFGVTHIMTIGLVDDDIKDYYEKYLKDTAEDFEEFKTSDNSEYEYSKPSSNLYSQLLSSINIKNTLH